MRKHLISASSKEAWRLWLLITKALTKCLTHNVGWFSLNAMIPSFYCSYTSRTPLIVEVVSALCVYSSRLSLTWNRVEDIQPTCLYTMHSDTTSILFLLIYTIIYCGCSYLKLLIFYQTKVACSRLELIEYSARNKYVKVLSTIFTLR